MHLKLIRPFQSKSAAELHFINFFQKWDINTNIKKL
jgi:hypothetical protein